MGKLLETEIFSEAFPISVHYGDVVTLAGKPLKISRLIQRCWGWPGKAAKKAEQLIKDSGDPLVLRNPLRQQQQMIAVDPTILESLLNGLSFTTSKNSWDAHRMVDGVELRLTEPIEDNGFVSAIIKALASRLGASTDEVRKAANFSDEGGVLVIDVDNYAHELGEGSDF